MSRSAYLWEVAAAMAVGLGVVRLVWGLFDGSAAGVALGGVILALGIVVMLWRRRRPQAHVQEAPDTRGPAHHRH